MRSIVFAVFRLYCKSAACFFVQRSMLFVQITFVLIGLMSHFPSSLSSDDLLRFPCLPVGISDWLFNPSEGPHQLYANRTLQTPLQIGMLLKDEHIPFPFAYIFWPIESFQLPLRTQFTAFKFISQTFFFWPIHL